LSAAFVVFAKLAAKEQGIPIFIPRNVPNSETLAPIDEVEKMKLTPQVFKGYNDVDELMSELLK